MKYPFQFTTDKGATVFTVDQRPHDHLYLKVSWWSECSNSVRSTNYSVEEVERLVKSGKWQVCPVEPELVEITDPTETYSVDALLAVVPKDMSIIINSKGIRLAFCDTNTGFNIDVRVKNGEALTEVIKAVKYFNSTLEAHKSE